MTVSVIVPFRTDGAERARNWAWIRQRYAAVHPDFEVVQANDTDPRGFCKGAALDLGVRCTSGDILIVADADLIVPAQVLNDAVHAARTQPFAVPYSHVRRLTNADTDLLCSGPPTDMPGDNVPLDLPEQTVCVGGGIVVISRDNFNRAGGMDHRFVGWGHEDSSWGAQLHTLAGPPVIAPGHAWHLWHPSARHTKDNSGGVLRKRYVAAKGDRTEMLALLAERGTA